MSSVENQRLMDCKTTAKYLGMSEAALRKRVFLRQIDCIVRIGGRIFFDKQQLDALINNLFIKRDSK